MIWCIKTYVIANVKTHIKIKIYYPNLNGFDVNIWIQYPRYLVLFLGIVTQPERYVPVYALSCTDVFRVMLRFLNFPLLISPSVKYMSL